MSLPEFLQAKRSHILDRWHAAVVGTYPGDAARFLGREKDRFRNPVGHSIREAVSALYDGLVAERPVAEMMPALDQIVRVRAVQDFSAGQAVGFAFLLKAALREELGESASGPELAAELRSFESAIDRLALEAFDVYVRCREQIFEIRMRDLKRRTSRLEELMSRSSEPSPDGQESATRSEGGKRA